MKKTFTYFKATALLLCMLVLAQVATAAEISCSMRMSPFTRTFEYLSSGTRVAAIETDEGYATGISLGFTFRFGTCGFKTGYTTVSVSSNGWLKFGTATNAIPSPGSTLGGNNYPSVAPFWSNLSGDGGTATYNTEVLSSGTKVFTMEWKNWRWDPTSSAVISMQVKLYEGSDIIEYCYKRESGTPVGTSATPGSVAIMNGPKPSAAATCYETMIFTSVGAVPVLNRTGAWGAGLTTLPPDDQVYQFFTACCGKPEAGVISQPDSVCFCAPFVAKVSGATPSPFTNYGIRYQWQTAASSTGPWTDVPFGTNLTQSFAGICGGTDTFLRVIVFCDSSNQTDTTPVKQVKLITLPYNCYCYSGATQDDNLNPVNIGNVKIVTKGNDTLINQGNGTPGFINKQFFRSYTLNTGLRPIQQINRDSTYTFSVMGITRDTFAFSSSGVALYIDYNHDNTYSGASELAAFQVISGTSSSFITKFTVPSGAVLDDTLGMRVIMKRGATTSSDVPPCGSYFEGETEDYLIRVTNPKCPGPLDAGVAHITDTSICYGYTTTIWDTSHAKNMSQMHYEWEYSLDNLIWANVPSGKNKDTITPVVRQSTYYRLRMVCEATKDTIYSNKVYIKLKEPYKCYCYSLATGKNMDSSDITEVKLGKYKFSSGGPHLSNPESVRMRTDYTDQPPMELWTLTKYEIGVYHTLRTKTHADAKISVFMDLNHNLKYDGASELVWSKITTATDYYPHDSITIPAAVIPNVETGMRVVLNNDLGSNVPNDAGCDAFESGEIEDFLVIFRRQTTGIADVTNVDNLQIYPNPNNGQFTLSFHAMQNIAEATVSVTNITGQEVYREEFGNVSSTFMKNINLGAQAAGVYFITLTADGQKTVNKLIIR